MFEGWTCVVGFWIGAAIGSFLNVVIYRLPRGMSIGKPKHSFCTVCKKQLTWGEMIPLISWLVQKGRCSCGDSKVAPRYFIVELVNGIVFAGIWYSMFCYPGNVDSAHIAMAFGYFAFAACLVSAIFTDLAHYIIPDEINSAMFVIGLAVNVALVALKSPTAYINGIPSSLVGAFTGIAVLWGIAFLGRVLFQKDAMGHGDIKMARGIGAVLLPMLAGVSFALAVVLGAVLGIVQVIVRNRPKKVKPSADAEAPDGTEARREEEDDDGHYEPESIGSLLWCGLGYLLCIDTIGLFFPKLYEWWFKENPYAYEQIEDDPEVDLTMIPFGPYLAAGALAAIVFQEPLLKLVGAYLATFGPAH